MKNRFTYYLSQGIHTINKSFLIIVAFSISLSLIAGLSYYSNAYKNVMIQQSFDQISDVDVWLDLYDSKYSEQFGGGELEAATMSVLASQGYDQSNLIKYGIYYTEEVFLQKNSNETLDSQLDQTSNSSFPLLFASFDTNFYESSRFQSFFHIEEGNYPQNPNEMLVDISYAQELNLTVNSVNSTCLYWEIYNTTHNYESKIVGLYSLNQEFMQFFDFDIYSNYKINNGNVSSINIDELYNLAPIFTYTDFSQPSESGLLTYENLIDYFEDTNPSLYSNIFSYQLGISVFFDRETVSFANILTVANQIQDQVVILRNVLWQSSRDVKVTNYLYNNLIKIQNKNQEIQNYFLLMNIPILLASIIIGSFARKTEIKTRFNEFLLLKSKGVPPEMIRNQFLVECIEIGVMSTILGSILGFGTFFMFKNLFNQVFGISPLMINFPVFAISSIATTLLYSMILSIFGSISSLRLILAIPLTALLSTMGTEEVDPIYDERSLFGKKSWQIDSKEGKKSVNEDISKKNVTKKDAIQSANSNVKYSSMLDLNKAINSLGNNSGGDNFSQQDFSNENLTTEENHVKIFEKNIKKYSILFLGIATFPLILYLLIFLSKLNNPSDIIILIGNALNSSFFLPILSVMIIISPIFFVWGIIRIIAFEKPSIFAKISKSLSKLYIGPRSYLVGLEMVRRKPYKVVMLIIAVFTSMFTFSNLYLNSTTRHDIIYQNLEVGADIQTRLLPYNSNVSDIGDVTNLEAEMKEFCNNKYETALINNILSFYEMQTTRYDVIIIDLEKYLTFIEEDSKILPNKYIKNDIMSLINYNNNLGSNNPGIIVNREFLSNFYNNGTILSLGEDFPFGHNVYNSVTKNYTTENFEFKISKVADVLPGLFTQYGFNNHDGKGIIVIDINLLNVASYTLPGERIFQLIDINTDVESSSLIINDLLQESSKNFITRFVNIKFYNQNWDSGSFQSIGGSAKTYWVIYLDFLIIGILLAFGLAILITALEKDNKFFNGVLLARGYGKSSLFKLVICEMSVIFIVGILMGFIGGVFFSGFFVRINELINTLYASIQLPLYMNLLDIAGILGVNVFLSFFISFIVFKYESRLNITQFFHKF